ncbi:large ribosomal subunit protein mL37 isoform X2 [Eleutherodactylus coqui]|uniref:large ribosomal subunit protein mL37 isoform X2 n=1 Tax=Eleutherodactylus coqui TaxID=57060 RepID=UPI003462B0EA
MAASMLTRSALPQRPGVRYLSVTASRSRKQKRYEHPPRREPMEIPGLERITFGDLGYFVPGLARPSFTKYKMDWNPLYYHSPPAQEMALYKERPSYVFSPKCRLLGGVKQALWLTKSKLLEGLPQRIASLCEDPAHTFPNHEELVHYAISNACLWSTTEEMREREEYCPKLLQSLLQLCRTQSCTYPALSQRAFVNRWQLATSWHKDSTIYHVRGTNGSLMSTKTPLEPLASSSEIQDTEPHVLESLYPLSPAIDLQEVNVYEEKDSLGFKDGFPYPHLHTVYLTDPCSTRAQFLPDQLRAKMIMIAFGGAVAKARLLFGDVKTLPQPVVVQSVGTDGQLFHFMVLQLNTLDFESNDGIKNLVWMDADQELYESVAFKPLIKRKVVLVPEGVTGFRPETFVKFWAMYLHGAV